MLPSESFGAAYNVFATNSFLKAANKTNYVQYIMNENDKSKRSNGPSVLRTLFNIYAFSKSPARAASAAMFKNEKFL